MWIRTTQVGKNAKKLQPRLIIYSTRPQLLRSLTCKYTPWISYGFSTKISIAAGTQSVKVLQENTNLIGVLYNCLSFLLLFSKTGGFQNRGGSKLFRLFILLWCHSSRIFDQILSHISVFGSFSAKSTRHTDGAWSTEGMWWMSQHPSHCG